jgi:hypothetical protein
LGLVAWWPVRGFDATLADMMSGTVATQTSAVGSAQRPTLIGDPDFGSRLQIVGNQGSYVQTNVSGLPLKPMSIAAWLKLGNTSETHVITGAGGTFLFQLTVTPQFQFTLSGLFDAFSSTITTAITVPWHVVVTYDGTTVSFYLNGQLLSTSNNSSSPGTATPFLFASSASGAGESGATNAFADIRWYNRVLSAADVAALYAPATRWDLYWRPSSRVFFDVAAAGGTVYNQSIALAVSSAYADSGPLTLSPSVALAIATTLTGAGGFSFNQAVALAAQAVYAASMQRGINEGITLQASGTVADSGPLGMNHSTGLTVSAAIAEAAALTVNSALTLGAIVGQSGFAGFAVAGSIALPTQAAAVAAFQYGVNALVTLVAQARDTESSTQNVAAAITLALQAAITESVTAALAAAANLGARASLSGVAGFQVQALITLIVAQQLAASYQFISGSGPQIIRLVAERLQAAALEDLSLSPAAVTNETIIDSN